MREIKFRAWVLDENRRLIPNRMLGWDSVKDLIWSDAKFHTMFFEQISIVPMQFTGLKDKNGKEIYEGDILRISSSEIVIVTWKTDHWSPLSEGDSCNHCLDFYVTWKETEIIGNIYENKELIQKV